MKNLTQQQAAQLRDNLWTSSNNLMILGIILLISSPVFLAFMSVIYLYLLIAPIAVFIIYKSNRKGSCAIMINQRLDSKFKTSLY